jgi:hypothetical protein
MSKCQQAIRELAGAMRDTSGNLALLSGIMPDDVATTVLCKAKDEWHHNREFDCDIAVSVLKRQTNLWLNDSCQRYADVGAQKNVDRANSLWLQARC